MTLLLEIGWTEEATAVAVLDTAAHSKVGEGRAANPTASEALVDATAWWSSTIEATRHAVEGINALGLTVEDLRGIVVAPGHPAGGLVALDRSGAPVHPAILGSHTGSGADADWLVAHLDGGEAAWLDATNLLPSSGSTVALLSWLHRSAPEAWAAAHRFTLPAGYLLERLGGDAAVASRDAVGTAVLDHRSGERWCTELLAVVDADRDWRAALPTIALTADPVGRLSSSAATDLAIPVGLPLHVGDALHV